MKRLLNKSCYGIDDLLEIMHILRSSDGCPWDKEQTHESIRQNFIEETYEVCDAIDRNDKSALSEELGDVLLQVVFHSCMSEEAGDFNFSDVTDEICKKLILRHPHIFSDVTAETSEQVLNNWDAIKKSEKGQDSYTKSIMDVPRSLPSLMRASKVQSRAAKSGFDWDSAEEAFYKIAEESDELKSAMDLNDKDNITEEIGDLLFAAVNVSRLLKIDPERALELSTDKFSKRFALMEQLAADRAIKMTDQPLSELDRLWDEAKVSLKSE